MTNDGEPHDMSQFTLGERYSSEDMYRDMGITRGSRIAFEKDGVIYTDIVTDIHWTPTYSPAPELTLRQRITRRLTPRRWRKPLPQPTRQTDTITVSVGNDGIERGLANVRNIAAAVDALTDPTWP